MNLIMGEHTRDAAAVVGDGDEAHAALAVRHDRHGFDGHHVRRDSHRGAVHDLAHRQLQRLLAPCLQRAAEVAVREGAEQAVLVVRDDGAAESLAGELQQHVDHLVVRPHHRQVAPTCHNVLHVQHELLAEASRGVVHRVVVLGEAARLHERDGHRVAEQNLQRRGRHGLLVVGAQLALQRQRDVDVAVLDKRRILVRRHCRQLGALRLGVRYKFQQLVAVALLKQEHQQVLLTEDTDVAVQRVCGR
mmetsp:Transcript_30014/g.76984  ORF Transcript_30014/g.76984 Transcript_30014/m.76984 type:complete len:247 (-) Transcript_30014:449-1189(-)